MATATSIRFYIALLVFMMANAVVFGAGMVAVLAIPALVPYQNVLVPLVVLFSFIIAVPISWYLAPRLRARYWRNHPADLISGPKHVEN